MLGTLQSDLIDGRNGEGCSDDTLTGDNGNSVLVGVPGVDELDGDQRPKDTDICAGDAGSTNSIDCEIIQ